MGGVGVMPLGMVALKNNSSRIRQRIDYSFYLYQQVPVQFLLFVFCYIKVSMHSSSLFVHFQVIQVTIANCDFITHLLYIFLRKRNFYISVNSKTLKSNTGHRSLPTLLCDLLLLANKTRASWSRKSYMWDIRGQTQQSFCQCPISCKQRHITHGPMN